MFSKNWSATDTCVDTADCTDVQLHYTHNTHIQVNLIPGLDGFYFQDRNYYLNDVDTLGSGGFGTCMFGKDHTTEQPFAMKRSNEGGESIIDSMRAECLVLSRLKPHDNIVGFLGAVIDEEDDNVLSPKVYKMFMELADCECVCILVVYAQATWLLFDMLAHNIMEANVHTQLIALSVFTGWSPSYR